MMAIKGMYSAIFFGLSPIRERFPTDETSYDHLATSLDQFYEDYRNRNVVVFYALQIIGMELQGANPDSVDAKLRAFRRLFSDTQN